MPRNYEFRMPPDRLRMYKENNHQRPPRLLKFAGNSMPQQLPEPMETTTLKMVASPDAFIDNTISLPITEETIRRLATIEEGWRPECKPIDVLDRQSIRLFVWTKRIPNPARVVEEAIIRLPSLARLRETGIQKYIQAHSLPSNELQQFVRQTRCGLCGSQFFGLALEDHRQGHCLFTELDGDYRLEFMAINLPSFCQDCYARSTGHLTTDCLPRPCHQCKRHGHQAVQSICRSQWAVPTDGSAQIEEVDRIRLRHYRAMRSMLNDENRPLRFPLWNDIPLFRIIRANRSYEQRRNVQFKGWRIFIPPTGENFPEVIEVAKYRDNVKYPVLIPPEVNPDMVARIPIFEDTEFVRVMRELATAVNNYVAGNHFELPRVPIEWNNRWPGFDDPNNPNPLFLAENLNQAHRDQDSDREEGDQEEQVTPDKTNYQTNYIETQIQDPRNRIQRDWADEMENPLEEENGDHHAVHDAQNHDIGEHGAHQKNTELTEMIQELSMGQEATALCAKPIQYLGYPARVAFERRAYQAIVETPLSNNKLPMLLERVKTIQIVLTGSYEKELFARYALGLLQEESSDVSQSLEVYISDLMRYASELDKMQLVTVYLEERQSQVMIYRAEESGVAIALPAFKQWSNSAVSHAMTRIFFIELDPNDTDHPLSYSPPEDNCRFWKYIAPPATEPSQAQIETEKARAVKYKPSNSPSRPMSVPPVRWLKEISELPMPTDPEAKSIRIKWLHKSLTGKDYYGTTTGFPRPLEHYISLLENAVLYADRIAGLNKILEVELSGSLGTIITGIHSGILVLPNMELFNKLPLVRWICYYETIQDALARHVELTNNRDNDI